MFFFSFPDHGDDAGGSAEERTKHSGGSNDGVISTPHNITAHQIAARDPFIPGRDEEHTEYGADDGQQLQQILAVEGEDKTR